MNELRLLRQVSREADQAANCARSHLRQALSDIECALNREDGIDKQWLNDAMISINRACCDIRDAIGYINAERAA